MPALRVRERGEPDEASHLGRVVVLDRGLQVLALRSRLAQLSAEGRPRIMPFDTSQVPAEQLVHIILAACDLEPRYD
jgi:hypothetical protein